MLIDRTETAQHKAMQHRHCYYWTVIISNSFEYIDSFLQVNSVASCYYSYVDNPEV